MRKKRIFFTIFLSICIVFFNAFPAFAMDVSDLSEDNIPMAEQDSDSLDTKSKQASFKKAEAVAGEIALFAVATTSQAITLAEKPTFQIELAEKEGVHGLYGTLSYIPVNTLEISVLYSFGGEYYAVENKDAYGFRKWDLTGLNEGTASLTQLCIGENDSPLKAYLHETINTLYVKLLITQMIQGESVETYTEAIKLSHNKTWKAPETPPDFMAVIEATEQGYRLMGKFADAFLPSTICIRPMYSLDGENYQVICEQQPYDWQIDKLGAEDGAEMAKLNNQTCANSSVEPLKSYLAGEINSFYTKLRITLEDGVCYDTKPYQIVRGLAQPIPDDVTISALFPNSMRVRNRRPPYTYGKYQITVREDMSIESIYAMLPDTVPVEIQLGLDGTSGVPVIANVEAAVFWKALTDINLQAGDMLTINDAANDLVIPAGTQLNTPRGIYVLSHDLLFDGIYSRDEICLVINVIAKDAKAEVSLRGSQVEDYSVNWLPITAAFTYKPSGATAIKAYTYIEGDKNWTVLGDFLTQRAIDTNQSMPYYGDVEVLQPYNPTYQRYLRGEVPGLLIALTIEGGVYGGETLILPWPGEYNPPSIIPKIDGSGGNENNAGSEDNKDNDSSNNGGQRDDLPGNELPPPDPEPTPDFTPAPTPNSGPTLMLTPVPTPASGPTPIPTPALTPVSGPTSVYTPALTPVSEPTPVSIPLPTPASGPNPVPTPVLELKPVITPTAAPKPETKPDFDLASLATDTMEITKSDQGNSTAAINYSETEYDMTQQDTSLSLNTDEPFTEPVDDGNITAQPSIEPNKPSVTPQEKLREKAANRQDVASTESAGQTATAPVPTERPKPHKSNVPQAVTVGVLAVGSVATIGVAAGAAGTTSSAGMAGKVISVLRKLLFRK